MLITVETLVRAPIAAVWKAWTTPEDIVQWNTASPDWHTTRASVDLRVGGRFCSRMEAKDGSMGFDFEGEYTEIVEQQLLVATFGGRSLRVAFIPGEAGVTVREHLRGGDDFLRGTAAPGLAGDPGELCAACGGESPGVIR